VETEPIEELGIQGPSSSVPSSAWLLSDDLAWE